MSAPGRPKREDRSAQREGSGVTTLLADIAYVRSGDKGDNVSIGVLARTPAHYAAMLAALTPERIGALFGDWVTGRISVFPMPNIDGCLVLLEHGLGGGATSTLRFDQPTNTISTEQHFVLDRGSEHLEGDGFRADPDFKNVAVNRPRGVAADTLLLPGQ